MKTDKNGVKTQTESGFTIDGSQRKTERYLILTAEYKERLHRAM